MTVWTPGWMQGGTYTAQVDRINSRAADWDEGVADRTALKVTQRGAGANLSVDVAIGACVVTGDDQVNQGNYDVYNDAVFNLTGFSAPGSNSRYDLVGVQLNDPNAGGAAGSNAAIIRVPGTAAASPTVPATPASFLPLAIVGPILTSTTQITTAMIHDVHTGTGPAGVTGVRLLQGFRDAPGTMKDTFNAVAPNGWLIAAGQAVSRTVFAALFEHFGTTFGAGDGASTFNLPDLRGRIMVALDNQGGTDGARLAAANTLGGTGGIETVALTQAQTPVKSHAHTVNSHSHGGSVAVAAHTHPPSDTMFMETDGTHVSVVAGAGVSLLFPSGGSWTATGAGGAQNPTIAAEAPGTSAASDATATTHENMPPYILGYKIIRT